MKSKEDKVVFGTLSVVIFIMLGVTLTTVNVVDCSYLFILIFYFLKLIYVKKTN